MRSVNKIVEYPEEQLVRYVAGKEITDEEWGSQLRMRDSYDFSQGVRGKYAGRSMSHLALTQREYEVTLRDERRRAAEAQARAENLQHELHVKDWHAFWHYCGLIVLGGWILLALLFNGGRLL